MVTYHHRARHPTHWHVLTSSSWSQRKLGILIISHLHGLIEAGSDSIWMKLRASFDSFDSILPIACGHSLSAHILHVLVLSIVGLLKACLHHVVVLLLLMKLLFQLIRMGLSDLLNRNAEGTRDD